MIQIDMKMPSSCYDCPFVKNERTNDYGSFCECGILEDYEIINLLEHSKHPNCPLIEQESMLDRIRDEIVHLHDWAFNRDGVLKIIDRYKAEREE